VAVVEFNLLIIRSMDGNEPFLFSGNAFRFNAVASFSNDKNSFNTEVSQSYPWPGSPPLTGAVAVETLKYSVLNPTHFSDSTYRLRFQVPYNLQGGSQSLFFEFSMSALQVISDESWGLDNVAVVIRQATQ
jgi:hypothetical protein